MTPMLPFSEACERNKAPILEILRVVFADRTQVLEIGSGTGQHAVHFAAHLTHLTWHPTEKLVHLPDLTERVKLEGTRNLRQPTVLDVTQTIWPLRSVDGIFSANTLHIMCWEEVEAMFRGLDAVLAPHGIMCVYGPFRYEGRYTSDSNRDFDRILKDRDPQSGLRDIKEIRALGERHALRLRADHDMPANNRLLEFARA